METQDGDVMHKDVVTSDVMVNEALTGDVISTGTSGVSASTADTLKWYDDINTYDDQLRRILLSSKLLNAAPAIQRWYKDQEKPRDVFYYVIKSWYVS